MRTEWPLGKRGEFPVVLEGVPKETRKRIYQVPGTTSAGHGAIKMTWDASLVVRKVWKRYADRLPPIPSEKDWPLDQYPGADVYREVFKGTWWKHQVPAFKWLAFRSYGLLALPERTGKVFVALGSMEANAPTGRKLIICPAGPRLGWAEQIEQKFGSERKVLLLYGRAGNRARWFGSPRFISGSDEVRHALHESDYVIVNYELVIGDVDVDVNGGFIGVNPALPGVVPLLHEFDFAACVLDESRYVARWQPSLRREGLSRRDMIVALVGRDRIPIVYCLDATPMTNGLVRSYWGQFDIMSGGLWGQTYDGERLPFEFDRRYCDGQHRAVHDRNGKVVANPWTFDGETNVAEFKARKAIIVYHKSYQECIKHMPPKVRQIRWLDTPTRQVVPPDTTKSSLVKAHVAIIDYIADAFWEELISTLEQGHKTIVFFKWYPSGRKVYDTFMKKLAQPKIGAGMRAARTKAWFCVGTRQDEDDDGIKGGLTPDQRHYMCKDFRLHAGAGVVFASWSSLSSGGFHMPDETGKHPVTTEHVLEQEPNPVSRRQAENRCYVHTETRGLVVVDWVPQNSITHASLQKQRKKLEALSLVDNSADAAERARLSKREATKHWRSVVDAMVKMRED